MAVASETTPRAHRAGAISGIDHVIVGVRDLDAAHRAFAHLGFVISPRGSHIGWATANFCIMFPKDYVELLGIVDATGFTNNSEDAGAAAEELRARGIAAEGPKDLKRNLELPEGTVQPAFKLTHLPAAVSPAAPSFVVQHLDRPMVWQDPWLAHENGARGVLSVTGVVAEPGDAALAFGALFGPGAVSAGRGCIEIDVGGATVRLTTPGGLSQLYPGLPAMPDHPPPWLSGMRLAVENLAATAAALDARGVPYFRDGGRILRVPPEMACGVVVEFAES